MKALVLAAMISLSAPAQAATKTLLYCKNVEQEDLKSITIQKSGTIQADGILELREENLDGSKKDLMATEQDLKDGYVPMSAHNGTERILIRKEGKWTVAGIKGDYRYFVRAECAE